ncbi:hypothetical protein [Streptomyces sp. OE57]|uniref:hypothetical protein n=1 Tax=Streptomyces lacaronensis TaxID=3379885 RepID=UPI0039B769E6
MADVVRIEPVELGAVVGAKLEVPVAHRVGPSAVPSNTRRVRAAGSPIVVTVAPGAGAGLYASLPAVHPATVTSPAVAAVAVTARRKERQSGPGGTSSAD